MDGPALTEGVGFDTENTLGREDRAPKEHDESANPTEGKDPEGFELRKISASQPLMLCGARSFSGVGLLASFLSTQIKGLDFFSLTSCGNPSRRFIF